MMPTENFRNNKTDEWKKGNILVLLAEILCRYSFQQKKADCNVGEY